MTPTARVLVSRHACERATQRIPGLAAYRLEPERVIETVRRDVQAALAASRCACRQPRWTLRHAGSKRMRAGPEKKRFVWTADESRCYAIVASNGGWVVLTVYERKLEPVAA